MIHIIYPNQYIIEVPFPSIFIAGPTPRSQDVKSWRPDFIDCLKNVGFEGTVFVPEPEDGFWKCDYLGQVEWEQKHLEKASLIIFWIPRNLDTLPGFTTNIEYGMYIKSGKVLYGRPDDSPKNKYLDYCYKNFINKEPINNLEDLAKESMEFFKNHLYLCKSLYDAVFKFFLRSKDEKIDLFKIKQAIKIETDFDVNQVDNVLSNMLIANKIKFNYDHSLILNNEKIIEDIIT